MKTAAVTGDVFLHVMAGSRKTTGSSLRNDRASNQGEATRCRRFPAGAELRSDIRPLVGHVLRREHVHDAYDVRRDVRVAFQGVRQQLLADQLVDGLVEQVGPASIPSEATGPSARDGAPVATGSLLELSPGRRATADRSR